MAYVISPMIEGWGSLEKLIYEVKIDVIRLMTFLCFLAKVEDGVNFIDYAS